MTQEEFINCCRNEGALDLEALDVALLWKLKDLTAWWTRQSDFTKGFSAWLIVRSSPAFTKWIAAAAGVTETALGVLVAEALIAATVGIGLGAFMDTIVRCKIMELEEIVG